MEENEDVVLIREKLIAEAKILK
jgi:hypothetical protein